MPNVTRLGTFDSTEGVRIAWRADGPPAQSAGPCGFFWLGGFKSDMSGTKAEAIAAHAAGSGRPCLRFDYSGHGESAGDLADGTISAWLAQAVRAFTTLAGGRRIVIGSSMGGWLALLLLRRLRASDPDAARRISGLVLLAPAVDMTKALLWARLSDAARQAITVRGYHREPSRYGPSPISTRAGSSRTETATSSSSRGSTFPVRRASCRAMKIPTSPDTRCALSCPARRGHPPHLDQGRRPPAVAAPRHRAPDRDDRGAGAGERPCLGSARSAASPSR